ncbi:secretin N-terminal domain-containing protein [Novipirellula artificiosorum]|uniref:Type II secretion system protein D n=1 Tax=Novipirellula artificiosorum TaxID=2528016 RepID=A0A5C6DJR7_9BACT|nr:secretin N-terminal domain-containing protein [Novipirellula artificiosorum]TWU37070.1 Type II secretion system protein D precursor [Novipirellula artificiosorum]
MPHLKQPTHTCRLHRVANCAAAMVVFAWGANLATSTEPIDRLENQAGHSGLMLAEVPDLVPIRPAPSSRIVHAAQLVKPESRVLINNETSESAPLDLLPPSPISTPSQVAPPSTPPLTETASAPQSNTPPPPSLSTNANSTNANSTNANSTNANSTNANSTNANSIDAALSRPGSITFRQTPLNEVVFLLSELWQVNIVIGENVVGEVSGTFHETPLREVLSAVLTTSGYSYRKTGSSLIVLPVADVGSDQPDFVSRTLRLPQSTDDGDGMIEAAKMLLGERGQIQKVGEAAVLVIAHPDAINKLEELFSSLAGQRSATLTTPSPSSSDTAPSSEPIPNAVTAEPVITQNGIAYFTPQYTEAEEMAESLGQALGDTVTVAVYAEENRIMVKGTPEELRIAAQAIEQLDVPRPQVRITAVIYDVAIGELEKLGINWSQIPHSSATALESLNSTDLVYRNTIGIGATGLAPADATTAGLSAIAIRTINSTYEATMLIQALDSNAEAKILADPTVTVGDRNEASIRIVQKIPVVSSILTTAGAIPQVEFEEAGIILTVTPRISRDGTIEMKVHPEYSYKADEINGNPVIDSRAADTTVRVNDGHLFVLGGLRQKNIIEDVRGVPYLKDIKYIGRLFRSHNTEVRESELIVFLKPEIVTPYSVGTPRQQQAACIANTQLDQIPYATVCPQTPDCKNPYCPNHNPRCRVNGGSFELEMLGDSGMECTCPHADVLYE